MSYPHRRKKRFRTKPKLPCLIRNEVNVRQSSMSGSWSNTKPYRGHFRCGEKIISTALGSAVRPTWSIFTSLLPKWSNRSIIVMPQGLKTALRHGSGDPTPCGGHPDPLAGRPHRRGGVLVFFCSASHSNAASRVVLLPIWTMWPFAHGCRLF